MRTRGILRVSSRPPRRRISFLRSAEGGGRQDIGSRFRYRRASRSRAFPRGDAHVFGGARRAHRSEIVTGRRMHATHPRRKALRGLASGGALDVHIGRKYRLRSHRKKRGGSVLRKACFFGRMRFLRFSRTGVRDRTFRPVSSLSDFSSRQKYLQNIYTYIN